MKEEQPIFKSGTFVSVPLAFHKIKGMTRSYAEVLSMIYSLSQGKGRGMQMSNPRLAEYLGICRKTVIRAFRFLREKEFIRNFGTHCCNRTLKPIEYNIRLAISRAEEKAKNEAVEAGDKMSLQVGDKMSPGVGDKMSPHIKRYKEIINIASFSPAKEADDAKEKTGESQGFIEYVFITRNGKRMTAYSRQRKHKSKWIQEQKRSLGIA